MMCSDARYKIKLFSRTKTLFKTTSKIGVKLPDNNLLQSFVCYFNFNYAEFFLIILLLLSFLDILIFYFQLCTCLFECCNFYATLNVFYKGFLNWVAKLFTLFYYSEDNQYTLFGVHWQSCNKKIWKCIVALLKVASTRKI